MQKPSKQQGKNPQTDQQGAEKQHPQQQNQQNPGKNPTAPSSNRDEQRNQKQNQASQLSAADQEQSPKMDRGSAGGSGESLRHGALDAQYGTDSSSSGQSPQQSKGGAGQSPSSGQSSKPQGSNPGSSEKSTGSQRDTLSGSRDSGRS